MSFFSHIFAAHPFFTSLSLLNFSLFLLSSISLSFFFSSAVHRAIHFETKGYIIYRNSFFHLKQIDGVLAVHEFHVWQLAGDRIIASAHIRCHNLQEYMAIAEKVKEFFHNEGIHSTTIQPEFIDLEVIKTIQIIESNYLVIESNCLIIESNCLIIESNCLIIESNCLIIESNCLIIESLINNLLMTSISTPVQSTTRWWKWLCPWVSQEGRYGELCSTNLLWSSARKWKGFTKVTFCNKWCLYEE